jgi:hypothetical protein
VASDVLQEAGINERDLAPTNYVEPKVASGGGAQKPAAGASKGKFKPPTSTGNASSVQKR